MTDITWSAAPAIATMIAGAVSVMPGVVASGAPREEPGTVYLAMRGDRGYRVVILRVFEYDEPEFDPLP